MTRVYTLLPVDLGSLLRSEQLADPGLDARENLLSSCSLLLYLHSLLLMQSANINVQDAIATANQVAPKRFTLFLGRILEAMIALKSAPSDIFTPK